MTRRTIWIPAHPRRLPAADAYERIHVELAEARRIDHARTLAEISEQIAAELDREYSVELT